MRWKIRIIWYFHFSILQDDEYVDEEGDVSVEVEKKEEAATTTTEAPKRIMLSVRPFRSNDELLNALKKRRMEAKGKKPGT